MALEVVLRRSKPPTIEMLDSDKPSPSLLSRNLLRAGPRPRLVSLRKFHNAYRVLGTVVVASFLISRYAAMDRFGSSWKTQSMNE